MNHSDNQHGKIAIHTGAISGTRISVTMNSCLTGLKDHSAGGKSGLILETISLVPERQIQKPVLLNCLHQPTLPISNQIDFPTHLFLLDFNSADIC